ncbi:hypothetical protein ACWD7F_37815 [Streptomyces sp. NPDC005122]
MTTQPHSAEADSHAEANGFDSSAAGPSEQKSSGRESSGTGTSRGWNRVTKRLGDDDKSVTPPKASTEELPAPSALPATLRKAGPHLIIAPPPLPGATDELSAALARLQAVPGALVLLAASPDAGHVLRAELHELGRLVSERGATTLVLAASGMAAAPAAGRRPAERFAKLVGVPVVAPDGMISIRRDGTLLVTAAPSSPPASWWYCPPEGTSEPLGPLWPGDPKRATPQPFAADSAQPAMPHFAAAAAAPSAATPAVAPPPAAAPPVSARTPSEATSSPAPAVDPSPQRAAKEGRFASSEPGGLRVSRLPFGHWLRSQNCPDGFHPSVLETVTARPGSLILVVGHPAEPILASAHLAAGVRQLLSSPSDVLLSAPWASPAQLTALAAELADELRQDVRAAVGLPVRTPGGYSARILDAAGDPTWEPYLVELTASPDRRRVVASAWRSRSTGWAPRAAALFEALPGWQLETVPAGLWLRPDGDPADLSPRLRRPDTARPLLLVGERGRPVTQDVWESVSDLLPPDDVQLGLLVVGSCDPDSEVVARFLARVHKLEWKEREAEPQAQVTSVTRKDPDAPSIDLAQTAEDDPPPSSPPPPAESTATPELAAPPGPEPAPAIGAPRVSYALVADPAPAQARPSTPAEREGLKALLGSHFQRCVSRTDQVATRLPSLRSSLQDDLKPDLVAVLLHHLDSGLPATRVELTAAARSSAPGPLAPFLACLGSGLRRLPSHHGPVLLGAHAGEEELRHYIPGAVLVEPAPVIGLPSYEAELGTAVEFAIWSVTGRRTALFRAPGETPEVVFPPGTRFAVLAVMPGNETGLPSRVLLREVGARTARDAGDTTDERDRQTRDRLLDWLSRRDQLTAAERRPLDRPDRVQLTPGVAVS